MFNETALKMAQNRIIHSFDVVDDRICLHFKDGSSLNFYHEQDCCERVYISDINGDWIDLLDTPLLVVEERVVRYEPDYDDSGTATFYTFRTMKGSVDVRWNGESNGFYSESVTVEFVE